MAEHVDASTPARNLPERLYGGFDVAQLADGSKRYALPHTLGATVLARTTTTGMLVSVVLVAAILQVLVAPFGTLRLSLGSLFFVLLTALPVHAIVAVVMLVVCAVTGRRAVTHITIRPDGLVWNDAHFYPAGDIWEIGYGSTYNAGKVDEAFTPHIEIQVGAQRISLADGIDPTAGRLFQRFFSEDTRRYWHGHN